MFYLSLSTVGGGLAAPRSRLPATSRLLNAHARGTYPVGNVHARVRGERGISDHSLAEGQPQKNLRRSDEQQKHDNHECQPLPLPPAPRGDALPDPLLPARGHLARFYTSASTDRYRHVLSICALNVLVFARLTARNGRGVVRQDNGVQRRAFAVGAYRFFARSLYFDRCVSVCPIERIGCSFAHFFSPCPHLCDKYTSR